MITHKITKSNHWYNTPEFLNLADYGGISQDGRYKMLGFRFIIKLL